MVAPVYRRYLPSSHTYPAGRAWVFRKTCPVGRGNGQFRDDPKKRHTCFRAEPILGLTVKRRPRSRSSSEKQTVQRTRLRITSVSQKTFYRKKNFFLRFSSVNKLYSIQYYLWYENHHSPKSSTILLKSPYSPIFFFPIDRTSWKTRIK